MLTIDSDYAFLTREKHLSKAMREKDLDKKDKSKGKLYYGKLKCSLVENVTHMLKKVERKFGDGLFSFLLEFFVPDAGLVNSYLKIQLAKFSNL